MDERLRNRFGYTDEDIIANRAGEISERQRAVLRKYAQFMPLVLFIYLLPLLMILLVALFIYAATDALPVLICVFILGGMVLIGGLTNLLLANPVPPLLPYNPPKLRRDIREGRIIAKSGILTTETGRQGSLHILLDGERVSSAIRSPSPYDEGQRYALYLAAHSHAQIGAEKLE